MSDRTLLRSKLRLLRQSLPSPLLRHASVVLSEYIVSQPWFLSAQRLGFYWPIGGEISLQPLMEASLRLGKCCYLPACDESTQSLIFARYLKGDLLVANRYQIPEPVLTPDNLFPGEGLDVVFAPLLAFDRQGNRLGSGKGYYDRTFAFLQADRLAKPRLVGLAYQFQEAPRLEVQPWDVGLNEIIVFNTELGTVSSVYPNI